MQLAQALRYKLLQESRRCLMVSSACRPCNVKIHSSNSPSELTGSVEHCAAPRIAAHSAIGTAMLPVCATAVTAKVTSYSITNSRERPQSSPPSGARSVPRGPLSPSLLPGANFHFQRVICTSALLIIYFLRQRRLVRSSARSLVRSSARSHIARRLPPPSASTMSLVFYYTPNSTAEATISVLDELEHGRSTPLAKRVEVNIKNGDTHTLDYLTSVNPNGRVPAIVHDGVAIWESAAIAMYLGETFGVEQGLYPPPGPHRGEAMKWIVWANASLAPAMSQMLYTTHDDVKAKARDDIIKCLDVLNKSVHGNGFLLGSNYTLADTHVWSFMSYIRFLNMNFDDHLTVKDWVARVGARPVNVAKWAEANAK
ncbi:hypothetical protein ANO11243_027410 [Dothideomycetidae sp. 11243]|nr:hypothetical protein ANO11243_027410 [fungal sp. No.11243]